MATGPNTKLEGVAYWYLTKNNVGDQEVDEIRQFATNSAIGWSDPDFAAKIYRKEDASLPYRRFVHNIVQQVDSSVSCIRKSTKQFEDYEIYSMIGVTAEPHVLPAAPDMEDLAVKRFKSKFGEHYSDFQALVPLAEIKETRNLIKSTAALTERLLIDLITIKSRRARKDLFKLAGDLWLQYSFAISPTIGDITDLTQVISDHLLRSDKENVKVSAGSRSVTSFTAPESYTTGYGRGYQYSREIYHIENGYRYTGAYNLLLKSSNDYNLRDRLGFSMKALPSVLWEVIPFSWVVDYFTTVGAYLDDRITSPPSDTIYLVRSQRYRKVKTRVFTRFVPFTGFTLSDIKQTPYIYDFKAFERAIVPSLPHRALRFKTYDEIGIHQGNDYSTSIKRLLNLGSILVSGRR